MSLFKVLACVLIFVSLQSNAGVVSFHNNQLLIDGVPQPQLYGAELQYFRLRGGYERNIPRAKVIELWERALSNMVKAKMNTVSFYIPWDFHEYAEGKFDFTGTVDEDGDGNPDYPSRDVVTFIKMIEAHGITRIMARPGPYINAEWGFLGFGAIPKWFHEKFPDSHMRNQLNLRTKLYDYHNPDLIRYSENWMKVVYNQVLKPYIGPGKSISFMQLDNETNFMWQSIFNHDHGAPAIARYREFLKSRYASIEDLNRQHGRRYGDWNQIQSPKISGQNIMEDQDWYRFQDYSMYTYLQKVRAMWTKLGVDEPTVLFTLAESYNAMKDGILPHYRYRNEPGKTGMMTVNLYPKTYDLPSRPLLNLPFKSDHNVKAADSASDHYIGQQAEWVFGPEIQGGWWKGIDVSENARKQTYLTTVGHGLKALMVYYFHEGDNWQVEWAKNQISPLYNQLKNSALFQNLDKTQLPQSFWNNLQSRVDREIMVGFDARQIMEAKDQDKTLFFDAPLDNNARPRDHFQGIMDLGQKFLAPHEDFLGRATAIEDAVCLIHDNAQHVPTTSRNLDSLIINGEWMGGLLGYLLQNSINPKILHWGLNDEARFNDCKVYMRHDNGPVADSLVVYLKRQMEAGKTVVNFLDSNLGKQMGLGFTTKSSVSRGEWVSFLHDGTHTLFSATPYFNYAVTARDCRNIVYYNQESVAFECPMGAGKLIQMGAMFHGVFNSDNYANQTDAVNKASFLNNIVNTAKVSRALTIREGGDRVAIFGRKAGSDKWITLKSGQKAAVTVHVLIRDVDQGKTYSIKDLSTGIEQRMTGAGLTTQGFEVKLGGEGSTSFFVKETGR